MTTKTLHSLFIYPVGATFLSEGTCLIYLLISCMLLRAVNSLSSIQVGGASLDSKKFSRIMNYKV